MRYTLPSRTTTGGFTGSFPVALIESASASMSPNSLRGFSLLGRMSASETLSLVKSMSILSIGRVRPGVPPAIHAARRDHPQHRRHEPP